MWAQIAAAASGSAACVIAQIAPIGAKICTIKAIRKIGRIDRTRRRANAIPPRKSLKKALT